MIKQPWPYSFDLSVAQPVDAKGLFDSLEQAKEQIPGNTRFKGQKFTVRGNDGEQPQEFWFIKDYIPAVRQPTPPFAIIEPEFVPDPVPYLPEVEGYNDGELRIAITGISGDLNGHITDITDTPHGISGHIVAHNEEPTAHGIDQLNGETLKIAGEISIKLNETSHEQ
ncbi:MAG: hypothetical protein LBU88_02835 [Treponema sp.]|jgi:FAD/FMN-containing dehydrogenase|nr:hypothetical protein [Treponema sp.]